MPELADSDFDNLRELITQARAHLRRQQRLGVERLHVAWPERRGVAPAPSLTLAQVREELGECTRCKLHTGRKHIVFGVGDPNAWLVFVGEAPGADEDEQGEPFVGRAGQLLTRIIEAMKLTREQVYICNIIKCFISPRVLIYTAEGYKPIKDIRLGDLVLTHSGHFRK